MDRQSEATLQEARDSVRVISSLCAVGMKHTAAEIWYQAEQKIEAVEDPIQYLALTLRMDQLIRTYFLPSP